MAYGDVSYNIIKSGSTATSANTVHNFFGVYGGLSDINNSEVMHVQVMSDGNEFRIGAPGNVSNNIGQKIFPAASYVDLPPMRVGTASLLQFANANSGSNASANWMIWNRLPL